MSGRAPATPPLAVGSAERLTTTLFLAALIHGVIILGVGFAPDDSGPPAATPTLEVTMVSPRDPETPDEARYLAQVDQSGGGNTEEQVRPQSPLASPSQVDVPGSAEGAASREEMPGETVSTEDGGRAQPEDSAPSSVITTVARTRDAALAQPAPAPTTDSAMLVMARLMDSSPDLLDPVDELDQAPLAQGELRERFITVDTREALFAEYLDRWRDRIERMGNLHYPDSARREGLEGSLILEVALNSDGTIRELEVRRAADHQVLNRSALRILRLSSPFEPFPESLSREIDVLRFVYEWRFAPSGPQGRVTSDGAA